MRGPRGGSHFAPRREEKWASRGYKNEEPGMNHLSLCEVIDWRTRERAPLFLGRRQPLILTNRSARKTQLLNGGLIDEKTDAISINRNVDNVPPKCSAYIYFRSEIMRVTIPKKKSV